jgi:xylulokinase/erythritol kinase/L-xylulokinase
MPSEKVILTLDLGTSHLKAGLFTPTGTLVGSASRPSRLLRPHPTWCEQDLSTLYADVVACLGACLANAGVSARAVIGLALTGQGDGTRLIAADGSPVRPAILWQDARATAIVQHWWKTGAATAVAEITGSALSASHQTAQLAWLIAHEPHSIRAASHVLYAKDWLFYLLTGVLGTDQSDASHTYLDFRTRQTSPETLRILDLEAVAHLLPPVLVGAETVAPLCDPAAAQIGLPVGLPVVLAPFDLVAELIAVGGVEAGVGCSVMGTAGIHQVSVAAEGVLPSYTGEITYIPGNDGLIRFVPTMLAMPNIDYWTAMLYPEVLHKVGAARWEDLEQHLAAVPPGAEGVLYVPFLSPSGERSPYFNPEARAQFTGMTLNHRREHLLRAVYEGVVLAAAYSYRHLPRYTPPLHLTGGGASSPILAQIFADMMGVPVSAHHRAGAALRGALAVAGVRLGIYPDLRTAAHLLEPTHSAYAPDLAAHQQYSALQNQYSQHVAYMFQK